MKSMELPMESIWNNPGTVKTSYFAQDGVGNGTGYLCPYQCEGLNTGVSVDTSKRKCNIFEVVVG